MKFPYFIKPFVPSPDVNWLEVSLDHHPALGYYTDKKVDEEFLRFSYRDLTVEFSFLAYAVACLIWPMFGLMDYRELTLHYYLITSTLLPMMFLDMYLHFYKENTVFIAKFRRAIWFIGVWICSCSSTYTIWTLYPRCLTSWDILEVLFVRPAVKDQGRWCLDFIGPYPIALSVITSNICHLPPIFGGIFNAAVVIQVALGLAMPYAQEDSARPLMVKFGIYILGAAVGFLFSLLKYRIAQRQFETSVLIVQESKRAEESDRAVDTLLCAMLPENVLNRMLAEPAKPIFDYTRTGTVFFSDMKGFTSWSSTRTAQSVVALLNVLCIHLDRVAVEHGVEKIKTIGDAYWAISGLPTMAEEHERAAYAFATAFFHLIAAQNKLHPEWDHVAFRVGLHTGPLWGAILGTQQLSYEAFGPTCATAMATEAAGVADEICATAPTADRFAVLGLADPSSFKHVNDIETREGEKLKVMQVPRLPGIEYTEALSKSFVDDTAIEAEVNAKAKAHREKFLAERTAARGATSDTGDDLETIHTKYSARKYTGLLNMTFADAEVEAHFQDFALE